MAVPGSSLLESETSTAKPTALWRPTPWAIDSTRAANRETLWLRVFPWLFMLCGVAMFFLLARRFLDSSDNILVHLKALAVTFGMQIVLVKVYAHLSDRILLGPGLRKLSHKVPENGAVPVRTSIVGIQGLTGTDEGYIWINDGTLFYKGLQTAFRLNACDLVPLRAWPRKKRPHRRSGRPARSLFVLAESGTQEVLFDPIDPFEDYGSRKKVAEFDIDMEEWLDTRPPGSLESLLPPSSLHPCLAERANINREAVATGVGFIVMNVLIAASVPWRFAGPTASALISGLVVACCVAATVMAASHIGRHWTAIKVRVFEPDGAETKFLENSLNDPGTS